MDEVVRGLLLSQGGAGSVAQARAAGVPRSTVDAMVRRGDLIRVRQDALILASVFHEADVWDQRTLRARSVGFSLACVVDGMPLPTHALSHQSALMVLRLPQLWATDVVHLVRIDGQRGRHDRTTWVHAPVRPERTVVVDGLLVVTPALAALQVAGTSGPEAGLVCLDGVLHAARLRDIETGELPASALRHALDKDADGSHGQGVRAEIASAIADGFGRGQPAAELAAELADPRSESAGESRARWAARLLGLGPCTPQFLIADGTGFVAYADLKLDLWPVLLEFDGETKYLTRADLIAEKWREDRLRELGYEVVRITWADLAHPERLRQRILAAIERARRRGAVPGPVSIRPGA